MVLVWVLATDQDILYSPAGVPRTRPGPVTIRKYNVSNELLTRVVGLWHKSHLQTIV